MNVSTVQALDHVDPTGSVVGSGDELATKVIKILRDVGSARVSFSNMHFVSSSYFNIFVRRILEECGAEGLDSLVFEFASPLQEQLFDRSRAAAIRAVIKPRTTTATLFDVDGGHGNPQKGSFDARWNELLMSIYTRQDRTLDDLPYTPQFEVIYGAVVGTTASDMQAVMSRQQLFHHLHNLRKAGKLPRLGRAASKPPRIDRKHEALLTQLVEARIGKLSLRDQLLYTPQFDEIVAAFNERAGLNFSAHDVWRVIAKLAK